MRYHEIPTSRLFVKRNVSKIKHQYLSVETDSTLSSSIYLLLHFKSWLKAVSQTFRVSKYLKLNLFRSVMLLNVHRAFFLSIVYPICICIFIRYSVIRKFWLKGLQNCTFLPWPAIAFESPTSWGWHYS